MFNHNTSKEIIKRVRGKWKKVMILIKILHVLSNNTALWSDCVFSFVLLKQTYVLIKFRKNMLLS